MAGPRIAIVHDWLNTKAGGGELVLLELADIYPEADIYTLLYDAKRYQQLLGGRRVSSSWLQHLPGFLRQRTRYLLPFIRRAIESFDLAGYDIVISSSSAFAKGVKTTGLHVCYCHSPMRFVWDYWPRYIDEQRVGPVRKAAIHLTTHRLRLWDYYTAQQVDYFVCNSHTVEQRIKKYYGKAATVIYPSVIDAPTFKPTSAAHKENYYVTLANLTPYKKIDLAIEACNKAAKRLIVIGEGSDYQRLVGLAGPTIEFVGRVSEAAKTKYLQAAKALIFANEEDFGIAPIEAMAAGTPVIAYGHGGLTETVIAGKTGVFFDEQTAEALVTAFDQLDDSSIKPADCVAQAAKFARPRFSHEFRDFVDNAYKSHVKAN